MKSDVVAYHAIEADPALLAIEQRDDAALPPHVRKILLLLISLITIGSHYGKHSLSSLGPEIMASLDVQRLQFGFLFSSQEVPGIILPIAGGLALTYVPHGLAAVVLSSSVLVSTALCAVAVSRRSYLALFMGRFLFGLADGALTTLQGALVAHWFRHRVGRSFGVTLFVSRISSFLGLSLPAFLSRSLGLEASMWFSAVMCLPPVIATIFYALYVARCSREHYLQPTPLVHPVGTEFEQPSPDLVMNGPRGFLALLHSFPLSFWLVCYLWVAVAGPVFSMLHFAPDAFSSHFGMSATQSGLLTGSLVLIAGLSSPAIGILQDRVGRRAAVLGASCTVIGGGILLCAAGVNEESGRYLVIAGLGLVALGLSAAPVTLLSSLALCVDDFVTPAALGLYKGTENAGLAVLHVLTGGLRDGFGSYVQSFLLLSGVATSGVLAAIVLGWKAPILSVPADELIDEQSDAVLLVRP